MSSIATQTKSTRTHAESGSACLPLRADERAVIEAIRELPFGAVEVVVHQSRIVQIVKTQKLRVETG